MRSDRVFFGHKFPMGLETSCSESVCLHKIVFVLKGRATGSKGYVPCAIFNLMRRTRRENGASGASSWSTAAGLRHGPSAPSPGTDKSPWLLVARAAPGAGRRVCPRRGCMPFSSASNALRASRQASFDSAMVCFMDFRPFLCACTTRSGAKRIRPRWHVSFWPFSTSI